MPFVTRIMPLDRLLCMRRSCYIFRNQCARKSVTVIAWEGQVFSHFLQPIQPTSQAVVTAFPFALELHATNVLCA